ncbi:MAG TPA: MoxR family ATPase [Rubricoccaceae bacterium]|jgi:MoxR-like ATPase
MTPDASDLDAAAPPLPATPADPSTPAAAIPAEAPDAFDVPAMLAPVARVVDGLRDAIGTLVVGQEGVIDELIAALLAGGHVLIEGVPGVAKTLTAKLLARASGMAYSRVQFTPDLMPSDVLGTQIFSPRTGEFAFHEGPIFAQIVLIDEINRAPAKTQSALFEVMEERQATIDGTTYPMAAPFMVLATQNPVDHEGTYRLPEAQLDRFLFKTLVGYPDLDDETEMLRRFQAAGGLVPLNRVTAVLTPADIEAAQAVVREVRVEEPVLRYAAQIVAATRRHPALSLGASPRASLALVVGAKAVAAMSGRAFATPDDVRTVVAPALRHRVQLTPEREIEGVRPSAVLQRIVEEIEVPR